MEAHWFPQGFSPLGWPAAGPCYYLTDALGSVTALTDQKGDVAFQYRFDAFGGLFTGTVGLYNTTGLTGKAYDPKSGLMDFSARWYDPTVGRFTQPDPFTGWLDEPMSQHRYTFVYNNPANYTDPTGMWTCGDVVSAGGGWGRMDCTNETLVEYMLGTGGHTEIWEIWEKTYWSRW